MGSEKRIISKQAERYELRNGETIAKEYPPHKSKEAHSKCFNK